MTQAPYGPTTRTYYSQRLRLHYVDWGNPEAPPLLMIHGGRDHCRNWDWMAERLRDRFHIICPDLAGHGDSQWSADGNYFMAGFIYDIAQLIHQQKLAPVTIIAHSLGGNIALRYTGLYPDTVKALVAIEGMGPSPAVIAERLGDGIANRMHRWIDERRQAAGRLPRRYATLDDACKRMQDENKHLSPAQARHLTQHGVQQNEDGTYSWKFDNYVRSFPPYDMGHDEVASLWGRITCPTLLVYGKESWASNPEVDGRIKHFKHGARVIEYERAGHWVHHDRLDDFTRDVEAFLGV
ncbi:alpha/beta fold hydrolase [Zavarzinia sp. CC-PAN008]|uniref:alpha/beta fold hydrolase n=1 Tax=Zavarzinia sp. CC-PAN008 TaxID=3243332 RepID=UPI003F7421FD